MRKIHIIICFSMICYGDVEFYDVELPGKTIAKKYKQEAPDFDQHYVDHLQHVFNGYNVKDFCFSICFSRKGRYCRCF